MIKLDICKIYSIVDNNIVNNFFVKWLHMQTPYVTQDEIFWMCELVETRKEPNDMGIYKKMTKFGFTTPELSYEFGINELAKTL